VRRKVIYVLLAMVIAVALGLVPTAPVLAWAPPDVTVNFTTVTVDEGQTAINGGDIILSGTGTVTLTPSVGEANWEDGVYWIWDWSFTTTDGPTESQPVTITFTDGNGNTSTVTFDLIVDNVEPVVDAGSDGAVNESETFIGSGSFTDPGDDIWTATVDYGDGSGIKSLALSNKTFNLSHFYADDGVYTVVVIVTDDDGGMGTDTLQVTVSNVPPEEQIEDISDFYDDSISSGQLVGIGSGNSATGKANALSNMLAEAERLIDEGLITEACQQLYSIYLHVDGATPPLDFVTGSATTELALKILALIEDLGCE
jgi:hypothetical protein